MWTSTSTISDPLDVIDKLAYAEIENFRVAECAYVSSSINAKLLKQMESVARYTSPNMYDNSGLVKIDCIMTSVGPIKINVVRSWESIDYIIVGVHGLIDDELKGKYMRDVVSDIFEKEVLSG